MAYKGVYTGAHANRKLTPQQMDFVKWYIKSGEVASSAIKAGYSEKSARDAGNRLLKDPRVLKELEVHHNMAMNKSIASATDVLNFLTRAMNGEIKDQFGLDATLSDRLKAAVELAKRTVDIEQRIQNKVPQISITLDWE